jgi:hypothetical protein
MNEFFSQLEYYCPRQSMDWLAVIETPTFSRPVLKIHRAPKKKVKFIYPSKQVDLEEWFAWFDTKTKKTS